MFRGKRIDNGEWVEGDLIVSKNNYYIHPTHNSFQVKESGLSGPIVLHEVREDTLGQFTRVCDKNGKMIFEGDILELAWRPYPQDKSLLSVHFGPYEIGGEDEYDYYDYVVGWYTKGSRGKYSLFADAERANLYYEVIGNIHDNPELLEGD